MIQRIQSLYILLAFLLSLLIFSNSLDYTPTAELHNIFISLKGFLWAPFGLLVSFFLFKKRKLQILFCWVLIIIHLGQLGLFLSTLDLNDGLNFEIFAVLESLLGIILLGLAKRNIQKDEALVRSVDRIR